MPMSLPTLDPNPLSFSRLSTGSQSFTPNAPPIPPASTLPLFALITPPDHLAAGPGRAPRTNPPLCRLPTLTDEIEAEARQRLADLTNAEPHLATTVSATQKLLSRLERRLQGVQKEIAFHKATIAPWRNLSDELLLMVFRNLTYTHLAWERLRVLMGVCRKWRRIALDASLWTHVFADETEERKRMTPISLQQSRTLKGGFVSEKYIHDNKGNLKEIIGFGQSKGLHITYLEPGNNETEWENWKQLVKVRPNVDFDQTIRNEKVDRWISLSLIYRDCLLATGHMESHMFPRIMPSLESLSIWVRSPCKVPSAEGHLALDKWQYLDPTDGCLFGLPRLRNLCILGFGVPTPAPLCQQLTTVHVTDLYARGENYSPIKPEKLCEFLQACVNIEEIKFDSPDSSWWWDTYCKNTEKYIRGTGRTVELQKLLRLDIRSPGPVIQAILNDLVSPVLEELTFHCFSSPEGFLNMWASQTVGAFLNIPRPCLKSVWVHGLSLEYVKGLPGSLDALQRLHLDEVHELDWTLEKFIEPITNPTDCMESYWMAPHLEDLTITNFIHEIDFNSLRQLVRNRFRNTSTIGEPADFEQSTPFKRLVIIPGRGKVEQRLVPAPEPGTIKEYQHSSSFQFFVTNKAAIRAGKFKLEDKNLPLKA